MPNTRGCGGRGGELGDSSGGEGEEDEPGGERNWRGREEHEEQSSGGGGALCAVRKKKMKTIRCGRKVKQGLTPRSYLTGQGDRGLGIVCAHDLRGWRCNCTNGAHDEATRRSTVQNGRTGAADPARIEASRKWQWQALEYCVDLTAHGTHWACQRWHKFHRCTGIEATCSKSKKCKEQKMKCLSHGGADIKRREKALSRGKFRC